MTDIAGRLLGVTVLVLAGPFLSGYITAVLVDAQATTLMWGLSEGEIADLARTSRGLVACIDADAMEDFHAMMPVLEAGGVPCLMLLAARRRDDPPKDWSRAALSQPFAGFQIVEALENLTRRTV